MSIGKKLVQYAMNPDANGFTPELRANLAKVKIPGMAPMAAAPESEAAYKPEPWSPPAFTNLYQENCWAEMERLRHRHPSSLTKGQRERLAELVRLYGPEGAR